METEEALGLAESGWQHHGKKLDPVNAYGGGMLRVNAVAEVYYRPKPITEPDDWLEIWWIGPESISHIILNGKRIEIRLVSQIRMLIK